MTRRLENRRALVSGGSRGIGAAIVKGLTSEGADVALTYVSKPDQARQTADAARALGVKAVAIQADSGPSPRARRRWSESEEYREIAKHRWNGTTSNVVILDGPQ